MNSTLVNFAHKPVLAGERVLLRPFTGDDADTIAEIIKDPEVIATPSSPLPNSLWSDCAPGTDRAVTRTIALTSQ